MLTVENLSVRYGNDAILRNVSLHVREGDWLMIVGPNGAGKSTLLSAIMQNAPYTGRIALGGTDIRRIRPRERARRVGILSQTHNVGYAFSVEEIVRIGRYAYTQGLFRGHPADEEAHITEALARTGLTELRRHTADTLSGGELQRTFLAQVFAQSPSLLLLDEPTNHLDLVYQKQVFALVHDWLKTPGRAVVSVVHDLSLARAYGTRAILLDRGSVAAQGRLAEVFAPDRINPVYAMDVADWMRHLLAQWKDD